MPPYSDSTLVLLAATALFAPVVFFLVLAALPGLRKTGLPAGIVSVAGALVSFGAALAMLAHVAEHPATSVIRTFAWLPHGGQPLAELGLRIDGVSALMTAVVALVATCVQVYSLGYMASEDKPGIGRYFAWQSLFLFSMLSLVLAPDMLQLFLGWELVGLCSYLLIGFFYQKPSAGKAAVKAFWVTKFADMGLLVGIVLMRYTQDTFSWDAIHPDPWLWVVALLIFIGAMGKSAQFPLHVWLPDAMEGPTPVSALLHAATMVAAGVYMIVRAYPIFAPSHETLLVIAYVGATTAFLAACTAVVQNDIKKVLAYSTCSQLGYMMASLGTGERFPGFFHLTTHACFKALLFLAAGAAIHAVHSNSIHDMGALRRKWPIATVLFGIGFLALIGFPGFAGFFSKDLVLESLKEEGLWVPFGLCIATAGLTAFYMARVVFIAFFGEPSDNARHAMEHPHATPMVMVIPMALLATLAVIVGWFGGKMAEMSEVEEYAFHLTPVGIAAVILMLLGVGLAWGMYNKKAIPLSAFGFLSPVGRFILWGPMDRFYEAGWRSGLLVVARTAGWIDRYVVDGLINFSGWCAIQGAGRIRVLQTGRVPDYVFAVILGFIFLAAWTAIAGGVR